MVRAKDYHLPDSASHTLSSGIALHPSVLFELLHTTFQLPLPLPIPLLSCALLRTLPLRLQQCCQALEGTAFERPLLLAKFCKALIFQRKKGYVGKAPHEQRHNDDGMLWYIPHHGMYHPQKPDKIRIVFDCSATFMGHSLNKYLLQDPDLTNSLVGVLCRFKK